MNDKELEESIRKEYKKMDVSVQIIEYVFNLAEAFVDRKMDFSEMLKLASMDAQRIEILGNRENAISTIMVNILTFSDGMIV